MTVQFEVDETVVMLEPMSGGEGGGATRERAEEWARDLRDLWGGSLDEIAARAEEMNRRAGRRADGGPEKVEWQQRFAWSMAAAIVAACEEGSRRVAAGTDKAVAELQFAMEKGLERVRRMRTAMLLAKQVDDWKYERRAKLLATGSSMVNGVQASLSMMRSRAESLADVAHLFKQDKHDNDKVRVTAQATIAQELMVLGRQFGRVMYYRQVPAMAMAVDEIELEHGSLKQKVGPFALVLLPTMELRVQEREGSSKTPDGFIHPHVMEGVICWGEASEIAARAKKDRRVIDLVEAALSVLRVYEPGSAYRSLDQFMAPVRVEEVRVQSEGASHSGECGGCGDHVESGEGGHCAHCGRIICEGCVTQCGTDGCESRLCTDCGFECPECRRVFCGCVALQVREVGMEKGSLQKAICLHCIADAEPCRECGALILEGAVHTCRIVSTGRGA